MKSLRCVLMTLLLWLFAAAAPGWAQPVGKGPHVPMTLVAETQTPAPGSDVALAFEGKPEPGWHGYWVNPGDAGIVTKAEWTLPEGVTASALRFPPPERLLIAGLMNYVYEHPFALIATLTVPDTMAPGTRLPVKVHLDYLVCTLEICVPESADLATELVVGDGAIPADRRAQFDSWRQALPKPLGAQATYQAAGTSFRMAIPYPAAAALGEAYFFPLTDGAIDYAAPQSVTRAGDRLVIETKGKGPSGPIEGVLSTGKDQAFEITAVPGQVAAAAPSTPAPTLDWTAALIAFAGAVLGGLLLNVMPCVFPILSLKALSLAKANAGDGNPRGEALAYTAGVVLVCLALGGVLLGLRAAGASAGWAFQLQNPGVIFILLLLVSGIAFNLAGLFEMMTPQFVNRVAAGGQGGAFLTGALAAFIATPCTGPFMGAALGAALVLPWFAALAVFAGLGLGIALPFLLLGFVPALRRRLPRPGPWMDGFRRILSIPMFLTAIALAWVLGRQTGIDGMTWGLVFVFGLALVLWGVGRRQAKGLGFGPVAMVVLLALAVVGTLTVTRTARPAGAAVPDALGAEAFSEARLAELRAEGRPVFAYFTADWCLTCKVNEKAVIETDAVARALADNKVAVLVGDWTDGDPALGRFIERHNRAGVPLYLWYAPQAESPQVLPQILTQAMLADLANGG